MTDADRDRLTHHLTTLGIDPAEIHAITARTNTPPTNPGSGTGSPMTHTTRSTT